MLYYKVITWFFKKVYKGIDLTDKSWTKHLVLLWLAREWNKWHVFWWDFFYNYHSSLCKEAFILKNISIKRIDVTDKLKLTITKCKMLGYTSKLLATSLGLDYLRDYVPGDYFFGVCSLKKSVYQYQGHILALFKDSQNQTCCVDCTLDSIIVYKLNPDVFDFFIHEEQLTGTRSLGIRLVNSETKSYNPWPGNFSWSAIHTLENLIHQVA